MTEITAQSSGTVGVGVAAAVAAPPPNEFAQHLSDASSAPEPPPPNQDISSGKVATVQPNAVSQGPDSSGNEVSKPQPAVAAVVSSVVAPVVAPVQPSRETSGVAPVKTTKKSPQGVDLSASVSQSAASILAAAAASVIPVLPTPSVGSAGTSTAKGTGATMPVAPSVSRIASTDLESAAPVDRKTSLPQKLGSTESSLESPTGTTQKPSVQVTPATDPSRAGAPGTQLGSTGESGGKSEAVVASNAAAALAASQAQIDRIASAVAGGSAQSRAATDDRQSASAVATPTAAVTSKATIAPLVVDAGALASVDQRRSALVAQPVTGQGQTQQVDPGSTAGSALNVPSSSAGNDASTPTSAVAPAHYSQASVQDQVRSADAVQNLHGQFSGITSASVVQNVQSHTATGAGSTTQGANPAVTTMETQSAQQMVAKGNDQGKQTIADTTAPNEKSATTVDGSQAVQQPKQSDTKGDGGHKGFEQPGGDPKAQHSQVAEAAVPERTPAATTSVPSTAAAVISSPASPAGQSHVSSVNATNQAAATGSMSAADKQSVLSQITDRIQVLAVTQPKEGVVVHLQPENLGTVTLVIKSVAQTVSAQMFVSDPHVKTELEQSRNQMSQQLAARGFHLGSVSISSASSTSPAGTSTTGSNNSALWQGQQQQQQQQQARNSLAASTGRTATAVLPERDSAPRSGSSRSGIDVLI